MITGKFVNKNGDECDIQMEEILCSIHNYTKFTDNKTSFYELAQFGLDCGLDVIVTTDKNVYPGGYDQFFFRDGKRVMIICGEEIFDPLAQTPLHHLTFGIDKEQFNLKINTPQSEVRISVDPAGWEKAFKHIEFMNAQEILQQGYTAAQKMIRKNLDCFDNILNNDQRAVIVAGTCSSFSKRTNTYPELLSTVCNHLLSDEALSGDYSQDKLIALKALQMGHLFTAIDGVKPAKGFSFTAEGENQDRTAIQGDTIYLKRSITLKINNPEACVCRLIRNGRIIREWHQCKQVPYTIYEPGCFRVECLISGRNNLYDWIFSNPIYVVKG